MNDYIEGEWRVGTKSYMKGQVFIECDGKAIALTDEANANLIAQSPRMAEWIGLIVKQGGWVYQKDLDEAKEIIRKALSKVEGD